MTMTPEKAQALMDGATPGPWHVGPRSTATPSNFAETAILSADGCCPAVALELPPETVANARLIAAAPDLARAYIAQAAEITRLRAKVDAAEKLDAVLWEIATESDVGRDEYLTAMATIAEYNEAGK